jgi:hypothetical protein
MIHNVSTALAAEELVEEALVEEALAADAASDTAADDGGTALAVAAASSRPNAVAKRTIGGENE